MRDKTYLSAFLLNDYYIRHISEAVPVNRQELVFVLYLQENLHSFKPSVASKQI